MFGQTNNIDTIARCNMSIGVRKHIKLPAARAHFLNIRFEFLEKDIIGRHGNDGHLISDQRERSMLQLAGRVGLRVDVRDFLQLKRALESDRKMPSTAEEQRMVLLGELRRPRDNLRL